MHFKLAGFLLGIALVSTIPSLSQKDVDLDPVTVTSSISPIATSKTGRNIITIKSDQFANLPINSIDELFRYLPGLEVQARGPMGAQSDFVIRGGTFQQVLVILDGLRLNDPLTGHFNSYIPIALAEIDRIEVLKGAASAIYGSEAVGGVIHIITKSFAARKEKQRNLSAQVVGGDFGLINGNIGGFLNTGKTAISAGLLSNNAKGQPLRGIKGYFNLHTASVSISHHINDHWQVAARSGYDNRDFAAQNFYSISTADTATEKVTSFWNTAKVGYQKNKNKLSLHAGYKNSEDEFIFNSLTPANLNKSSILQSLLQYEHQFNAASIITTGAQLLNRKITSNNRGDHNEQQVAGFISFHQTLWNSFTMAPSLRLDWNENRDLEWIPQINLSWKIDQFQLRGSAGKTIRDADFTERYNNYNRKNTPNLQSIGNPDLEAERSLSYELGVDLFATEHFKFSSTYFQRDHKKLIDYVITPYANISRKDNLVVGNVYRQAKNIAEVTTTGVETDLQYRRSFTNNHSLQGTLGLVWLNSESSETTPSFYVSSHARFLTNFSLQYSSLKWRISTNGLYKKRDPQRGSPVIAEISERYFVMNGKAELLFNQQKLSIFTQVDNIFDERYSDLLGSKMPKRWLMFGAKFNL